MTYSGKTASNAVKSSVNILVHVIILFSFLSLFFFMYISKVESAAFKNELGGLVSEKINELLDDNPELIEQLEPVKGNIASIASLYNSPSETTVQRNISLKFLSAFTVIALMGILLTIVLTLSLECGESVNLTHILIENVVIFICIGIVEYMFFTRVAIKYVPVVPSTMTNTLLQTFKDTIINS
jgi:hypothetical protein